METKMLAGAVLAATAVVMTFCAAAPASATSNIQTVGIEETLGDPNGPEIAYTVTKIMPSADPVAYPVAGQLYEATVMARANRGTAIPVVPSFNARAESGANYPALSNVSSLSGAPLAEGASTDGKVYFDVVGDVPNSIVYNDGPEDLLAWIQPVAGAPVAGSDGSSESGGSSSNDGGGSRGVTGSTGPNLTSPQTSGGEAGNTGVDGTEGGGGNLSSGGGSGAPNGDTGGSSNGSGSGSGSGGN